MKIGLYFGSFNPVHLGHLIVANSMMESLGMDEIWLIVSPQSPFKQSNTLADEQDRLKMTELAVANHDRIKTSDIEFKLPQPSYTIDTLKVLMENHPDHQFCIIMGKDNLVHFDKWKDYESILEKVELQVYDRMINATIPDNIRNHPNIYLNKLPLINVSSTMIRRKVADGQSIRYWVRDEVADYIDSGGLYRDE